MSTLIQLRRDTESNWALVNPILAQGEIGIVINTVPKKIKIGDGLTTWNALSVWGGSSSGSVGLIPPALMSVNSTDPSNLLLYWSGNGADIVLANGTVIPTSTYLTTALAATNYQPISTNLTNISSLGNPLSNGYVLSSTTAGVMSWIPVSGGGGTVTSVGLIAPSIFTVSGSPIATNGSLSFAFNGASTEFVLGNGATVATSTYVLTSSISSYLTIANASSTYQPLDGDLTAIAGLAGTVGLARKTAANTWSLDTNTYLTSNQTVTLSGVITGAGTTAITTSFATSPTFTGTITLGSLSGTLIGTSGVVSTLSGTNIVLGNGTTIPQSTFLTSAPTITLTGNVTGSGSGSITTTIAAGSVSLAMHSNLAANSIIGNNTGSPATPIALTVGQVQTLLNILTTTTASSTYQPLATNLTTFSALGNPTSNGYVLSSTTAGIMSWIPVSGGGGTVTSVGLSAPSIFTVTNSPVSTTGTLTFVWNGNNTNFVLADGTTITRSTYSTIASPTFTGIVTTPALTMSGFTTGTLINTSGVVSALSGTNLVLGNGTTIAQSTFQGANAKLSTYVALANPGIDGYVLSSTTTGVLSWIAPGSGGMSNPLVATGDMIYSSSFSTPARLAVGTTNQVLIGGTVPVWSSSLTLGGKLTVPASIAGSAYFNIPQGAVPTAPNNGDIWLTNSGYYAQIAGATVKLNANGSVYYSSSSAITVSNTISNTSILSTAFPSGSQSPGNVIEVKSDGIIAYNTLSDTITITIVLGSVTLGTFTIAGTDIPSGITGTNYHWSLNGRLSPQSALGSTATVDFFGTFTVIGGNSSFVTDIYLAGTVDTTISNSLNVNVQWSAASVGNTITANYMTVAQINAMSGGNAPINVAAKNSNYSMVGTDGLITITGASIITITLPTNATIGQQFIVKRLDVLTTSHVIAGTIDGNTNYIMSWPYESIIFIALTNNTYAAIGGR